MGTITGKWIGSHRNTSTGPVAGITVAIISVRILEAVTDLRAECTALIDRLNAVFDEVNTKLGNTLEGKDNEAVVPYRLYVNSVGGIKVDALDKEAAWATIAGWIMPDEGGIRRAVEIVIAG